MLLFLKCQNGMGVLGMINITNTIEQTMLCMFVNISVEMEWV